MSSLVVLSEQDMEWFLGADDDFPRISYHNNNVWATYNDLVRALGQPTFGDASEDGKVNVEWMGVMSRDNGLVIPNSAWTLYDWKEPENPKDHPNEEYGWHIGSQGGMLEMEIQDLIMRELQRVGASRRRQAAKKNESRKKSFGELYREFEKKYGYEWVNNPDIAESVAEAFEDFLLTRPEEEYDYTRSHYNVER